MYKNFRRKGFADNVLLGALAIAALVVMSVFLYNAYIGLKEKMMIQDCKNSISAHGLITVTSKGEIFTDIKCPTNEITIKDNSKAQQTIADDMHRCWYEWGQGNGQYFKGDGVFCHICSLYAFSNKGQQITGLMQYMAKTPLPIKYPGDTPGITYLDYLQGFKTSKSAAMVDTNIQSVAATDSVDTSKEYATIFVYASGKEAMTKALEGNKAALASFGGTAFLAGTAATGAATVGIISGLTAATIAGTVNAWNPVGWVILGGVGLVGIGVGAVSIYTAAFGSNDPEWVSFVALRPYSADQLDALGCEKLDVNQMSNK